MPRQCGTCIFWKKDYGLWLSGRWTKFWKEDGFCLGQPHCEKLPMKETAIACFQFQPAPPKKEVFTCGNPPQTSAEDFLPSGGIEPSEQPPHSL